jgi:hypothetical protein
MLEKNEKDWKQLCSAIQEAKDPGKLLQIVQELNHALQREERTGQHLREAGPGKASEEARC